jgi:RNA recognition motif-containing protein
MRSNIFSLIKINPKSSELTIFCPGFKRKIRYISSHFSNKSKRNSQSQHMFITYHIPVFSIKVDNLDTDVTEQDLFTFFSCYGAIQTVRVIRNEYQQALYGFVNFFQYIAAKSAFEKCVGKVIKSNVIRIMFEGMHQNRLEYPGEAKLMIKSIDKEACEKALQNHFRTCGNIVSVAIVTDEEGKSLGRGFVQFTKIEEAAKAYTSLNGSKLGSKMISIHLDEGLKRFIEESERKSLKKDEVVIEKLSANFAAFKNTPKEQQKLLFGELMTKKVSALVRDPIKLMRIVAMMIDLEALEAEDILEMLKDDKILKDRVQEGLNLLSQAC